MSARDKLKIAIIGAGPSGIATGRELLQQGFSNFTIYDKESAAGGTWHMHTYPGLACDVWAHSYTFSYAPNPEWSSTFVTQPEIEKYLQCCAKNFGLEPFMKFGQRVVSAKLQADYSWQLTIEESGVQRQEFADIVINCMGNQHTPLYPKLQGLDSSGSDVFAGPSWHSTNWQHDVSLQDKNVVVIGSAAAAIQIIPEIAKEVGHLTILQRSANWIMPRNNKNYSLTALKLFKSFPWLVKSLRFVQGVLMNLVYYAVSNGSRTMTSFENICRRFIDKAIDDPELKKAVTPDSRYGCKRPLVSDDYYPALNRGNVTLKHIGAKAITSEGVITSEDELIKADVIIYCTGYKVLDFDRIEVVGVNNSNLAAQMEQAPSAYKGIAVPNFPNYFFSVGPNAVVLTVSYYKSIEANVRNIVSLIASMSDRGVQAIDAKATDTDSYNTWVIENCKKFSWGSGECHNYYINESGQSTFIYPGTFKQFLKMRANCKLDDFNIIYNAKT